MSVIKLRRSNMDNEIGVIKEIDALGRIVIPKDYRNRLGLTGRVEVVLTQHGVLIKKPENDKKE